MRWRAWTRGGSAISGRSGGRGQGAGARYRCAVEGGDKGLDRARYRVRCAVGVGARYRVLGRCAMAARATENKSNEALLWKAMTTKYPSMLVLMEMAEELSRKNWELQLKQIRKDLNQLTNQEFQGFDLGLRATGTG